MKHVAEKYQPSKKLTTKTAFSQIKRHKAIYLMALPALLWYLIFKYIPLMGSVIAFQNYSIFKELQAAPL